MMARRPSSSLSWRRVFRPSYYLNRPERFMTIFIVFICLIYLFWNPRVLRRDHREEVSRFEKDIDQMHSQIRELNEHLGKISGKISIESSNARFKENHTERDYQLNIRRREMVKKSMVHAWTSYEKYAWGKDELQVWGIMDTLCSVILLTLPFISCGLVAVSEAITATFISLVGFLQPQSKSGIDNFCGLGATIVDSLDTLYIMGLNTQFQKAKEWVALSLNSNKECEASVFETNIRIVGGLLSAYDLSGDKLFLEKAKDIADRLLPAWNTLSGIPYNKINLASGHAYNPSGGSSIIADSATEQLEFITLSQRTGDPKYQQKVENVINKIEKIYPADGLLPVWINAQTGQSSHGRITFGGMGDSFYEYLLKVWIHGNKTQAVMHYRQMWETSMKGLRSLVRKSTPSSFTYLCDKNGDSLSHEMEELACFVPGMLALGSFGYDIENAQKMMSLAEELVWTCYNFYQMTHTKLPGERYYFQEGKDMSVSTSWNILRPETVESLLYLWRFTGNKTYQEWGWNIFQAFEKNSRIYSGYVGHNDVNTGVKNDMMSSFFLAETLKYLYLLFSPSSLISFDEWVFNTEAHPLRITPRLEQEDISNKVDLVTETRADSPPYLGRKEGRLH